jgi:hypothetical protein
MAEGCPVGSEVLGFRLGKFSMSVIACLQQSKGVNFSNAFRRAGSN